MIESDARKNHFESMARTVAAIGSRHPQPRQQSAARSPRRGKESPAKASKPRRASDVVHVRQYIIPSWFDPAGVRAKRKQIEAKGLPSFQNWRFITLTIDRGKFGADPETKEGGDPLAAYLAGVDRLRRFMAQCRKLGLWVVETPWCWKLEFHQDGWPHWHLLVGRKAKFTQAQLKLIRKAWGLGRTKTQRVNQKAFRYDFKYAFKPVVMDAEDGRGAAEMCAPAWFLDYVGAKVVTVKWTDADGVEHSSRETKPTTFARVRFWQTSRGFYTGRRAEQKPAKPQETWRAPRTVREIVDAQHATVQVVARDGRGYYLRSQALPLSGCAREFWNLVGFDCSQFGAVGLGFYSYVIPTHRLKTDPKTKWTLQPLLDQNRLTLQKARWLQRRGETLRTC